MEPQKERVCFQVDVEKVPPKCRDVVLQFKQAAEEELFKWTDDFDLTPPPSFFDCTNQSQQTSSNGAEGDNQMSALRFEAIFVVPDFDEMDVLARDQTSGDLIRLSDRQLECLRLRGEFDVDSVRFPQQRHRWRLNRFFQKGTANTAESFRKDVIRALQLLLVTARNRWWGQGFSVRQSLKGFWKGLVLLTDLFIGLPHTNYGDVQDILKKELQHFLVCELNVKSRHRTQVENCWNFLEMVVNMKPEERYDHSMANMRDLSLVAPPFLFVTPGKVPLDLRLHSDQVWFHLKPALDNILNSALEGWFFDFRDKMVSELKKTAMTSKEIAETVNNACKEEFHNRLFEMVRNSPDLDEILPGIGETLVQQARFSLICHEVDRLYVERQQQHVEAAVADFSQRSPILSAMAPKLRALRKAALAGFEAENRFGKCELALQRAIEERLEQHAYFVSRLLQFWRERVPLLETRVRATRQIFADNIFTFKRHIWFPHHWIVRQSNFGITTQVETQVISEPQTWGRAAGTQIHYTVHKKHAYRSSTRYVFWRWTSFFIRHFVFMMNAMYYFALALPFGSSFGCRALVSREPFYPRYTYDSNTGVISPDSAYKTHTFLSRLFALWRHVRRSRRQFEEAPNTGLIDKSVTRHPNRFWNYVLKGAFGTLLLVLLYPLTCLVLTLVSFCLFVTAPLWTFAVSFIYSFFFLNFIYDRNKPATRRNRFFPFFEATLYHWAVRGVLQMALSVLTAVVLCPLLSLILFAAGVVRFAVRSAWDAALFQVMVKRYARVPCKDDWVARRISGPGLASSHFYKARPDQVLLSLLAVLEREELNLWYANKRVLLNQPTFRFMDFMKSTMSWFSLTTNYDGVLTELRDQKERLMRLLADVRTQRASALRSSVNFQVLHKMKLSVRDLDTITKQALPMIEAFYNSKLVPYFNEENRSESEENWWIGRSMSVGDFMGLFNNFMTEEFGEQILIPLEESDTFYSLDVQHLDLQSYVSMIIDAEPRDDLDEVKSVLNEPKRLSRLLITPSVDFSVFKPEVATQLPPPLRSQPEIRHRRRFRNPLSRRQIKKRLSNQRQAEVRPDSLSASVEPIIPLQLTLYHPVLIALLLHKRDRSDQMKNAVPLPLSDPFLRDVLDKIVRNAPEGILGSVRTASLNSVNPDLLQSTSAASPIHAVATIGTPSVATTEDDDDDEEWNT